MEIDQLETFLAVLTYGGFHRAAAALNISQPAVSARVRALEDGLGVKLFAHAVRSHWGVENGCHWSLDFIYREDESRIRDKHLRENFAWLNRFTLSLLKQHPSGDSTVMKRRSCGWSDDFLLEVLTGATS